MMIIVIVMRFPCTRIKAEDYVILKEQAAIRLIKIKHAPRGVM